MIHILNSIIMKSLKEFLTENLENPTITTSQTVQENIDKKVDKDQENLDRNANENNENILQGQTDTAKTE